MKVRITQAEFNELHEMSLSANSFNVKPENKSSEYLLAYELFKTLLLISNARERIRVIESIKANIELIDNE